MTEAALTGESLPVQKDPLARISVGTPMRDRGTMTYASTLVTVGQAVGIVVAAGDDTVIGRISALIAEVEDLETPLSPKNTAFSNL